MLSPILSCHDIEASIEFYQQLGFDQNWVMEDQGEISFACVKLIDVEILLGVIDFVDEKDRDKLGIGIQLYIEVPDQLSIDTLYSNAKKHKLNIIKPIENRDWGERVFVIHDLDGYNLMLAQKVTND